MFGFGSSPLARLGTVNFAVIVAMAFFPKVICTTPIVNVAIVFPMTFVVPATSPTTSSRTFSGGTTEREAAATRATAIATAGASASLWPTSGYRRKNVSIGLVISESFVSKRLSGNSIDSVCCKNLQPNWSARRCDCYCDVLLQRGDPGEFVSFLQLRQRRPQERLKQGC